MLIESLVESGELWDYDTSLSLNIASVTSTGLALT